MGYGGLSSAIECYGGLWWAMVGYGGLWWAMVGYIRISRLLIRYESEYVMNIRH